MEPISYSRHRFPPVVIQHAVWLYFRFTLSYLKVEELLAERGLMSRTRQSADGSRSSAAVMQNGFARNDLSPVQLGTSMRSF